MERPKSLESLKAVRVGAGEKAMLLSKGKAKDAVAWKPCNSVLGEVLLEPSRGGGGVGGDGWRC